LQLDFVSEAKDIVRPTRWMLTLRKNVKYCSRTFDAFTANAVGVFELEGL